jgi:hypothetical protein
MHRRNKGQAKSKHANRQTEKWHILGKQYPDNDSGPKSILKSIKFNLKKWKIFIRKLIDYAGFEK